MTLSEGRIRSGDTESSRIGRTMEAAERADGEGSDK